MDLEFLRHLYLRRVVGTALSMLDVGAGQRLAGRIARGIFNLHTPRQIAADERVRDWLGAAATEERVRGIVAGMYEHVARFWIETLHLKRRLHETTWRSSIAVEGEPVLRRLADSRRGCLIATACFGNPAVAAWTLGQIFRPIYVVADRFAQPILGAWQRDLYSHRHVRIIERSRQAGQVARVIENGGAIMLLCDTPRLRGRVVPVDFLGRTLDCYPTLGVLSKWLDVPVVPVVCTREPSPFRFRLRCLGEASYAQTHDAEDVVRWTMARLESAIAADPEQYLWFLPTGGKSNATRHARPRVRKDATEVREETSARDRRAIGQEAYA